MKTAAKIFTIIGMIAGAIAICQKTTLQIGVAATVVNLHIVPVAAVIVRDNGIVLGADFAKNQPCCRIAGRILRPCTTGLLQRIQNNAGNNQNRQQRRRQEGLCLDSPFLFVFGSIFHRHKPFLSVFRLYYSIFRWNSNPFLRQKFSYSDKENTAKQPSKSSRADRLRNS